MPGASLATDAKNAGTPQTEVRATSLAGGFTISHEGSGKSPAHRRPSGRSACATSSPDHHAHSRGRQLQAVDAETHLHGTADHSLGIERQDEVLNQEIERLAVDLDA